MHHVKTRPLRPSTEQFHHRSTDKEPKVIRKESGFTASLKSIIEILIHNFKRFVLSYFFSSPVLWPLQADS
jgi:hypothetical protein